MQERIHRWLESRSLWQVASLVGAVIFCAVVAPILFTPHLPLQDLPNHLASAVVALHPGEFPNYVPNSLFKTNAALFAWLELAGPHLGFEVAARMFVVVVLLLGSVAWPALVLHFRGRRPLVAALPFFPLLAHNWFVAMGMLDFALAVPLALLLLVALHQHDERPSPKLGLTISTLGVLAWYAHAFPLLVVLLLAIVHVVTQRRRLREVLVRVGVPLMLPALLVSWSLQVQRSDAVLAPINRDRFAPIWDLAYGLWAEWWWSFSWRSAMSLVPCLAVVYFAVRQRKDPVALFSPLAFGVLAVSYLFAPSVMGNWFHVSARFVPFLVAAALLRLPARLPPFVWSAAAVSTLLSVAGTAVDYVRLGREHALFRRGIPAVEQGAKLLPLIFDPKGGGENTTQLLHAWGYYVTEKHADVPLLLAHSHAFPITYRTPPPRQFHHLLLEYFAQTMRSPESFCSGRATHGLAGDCSRAWREEWNRFWTEALPRFDHVLLWRAPREVRALVPSDYQAVFENVDLTILRRAASVSARRP